jgi:hypothetical protein
MGTEEYALKEALCLFFITHFNQKHPVLQSVAFLTFLSIPPWAF